MTDDDIISLDIERSYMLVSFLVSCCFGILGVLLLVFIVKAKIENKNYRKMLVTSYKVLTKISLIFLGLSIIMMALNLYSFLYVFVNVISGNVDFARYISLTLLLICIEPITLFILKSVKKKLFKENEKCTLLQGTGTCLINKIIQGLDKLPIKGLIHITNLVLVILANSLKIFSFESGLTTSSIYMSIATYYALDKVIDYFKKKYDELWEKIDNKIFETDLIDKSIQYSLHDLENSKMKLFERYIETGKYGVEGN